MPSFFEGKLKHPFTRSVNHSVIEKITVNKMRAWLPVKHCFIFNDLHFHFFFDFPAVAYAIATACFCGFPARISVAMFLLIVFLDEPFLSGIKIKEKGGTVSCPSP
jgi:hypothetical protein